MNDCLHITQYDSRSKSKAYFYNVSPWRQERMEAMIVHKWLSSVTWSDSIACIKEKVLLRVSQQGLTCRKTNKPTNHIHARML